MIIGISGKIGSGKDTVGLIIQYLMLGAADPNTFGETKEYGFNQFENRGHTQLSQCQIKKFAFKLKQMVSMMTGIPVQDLEKQEVKDSFLGPEWDYWVGRVILPTGDLYPNSKAEYTWPHATEEDVLKALSVQRESNPNYRAEKVRMTVRSLLQKLGTDGVRNNVHPNAWVNALMADYKAQPKGRAHLGLDLSELYRHTECRNCKKPYSGYKRQYLCKSCIEDDTVQFYPHWIITDTRFPNEAKAIEERKGILIRVERDWDIQVSHGPNEIRTEPFDSTNPAHVALKQGEILKQHPSETALDSYSFKHTIHNNGTIEELIEKVRVILKVEGIL